MCAFSEFFCIAYIFKMVYSDWFLKSSEILLQIKTTI